MNTESNLNPFNRREESTLQSLPAGPEHSRHAFLGDGLTFGQLYAHAQAIGQRIGKIPETAGPVCLCAEDRGLVTATLIAALMEDVPLLIPYAFDINTLNEAHERMPFTYALVEHDRPLPVGVSGLPWPQPVKSHSGHTPREPMTWDQTWVYLFTGGSTGTPKIWSKTPGNLLGEAVNLAETFKVTPKDAIVATVPTNHIYGLLYSILLPLVSGATVEVSTPSFPHEIVDCLKSNKATILVSIPAHYRALRKTPIENHQVRLAFSSAGVLPERDAARFYEITGITVTEIYGSTETGGIAQRTRAKGQTAFSPFDCLDVRIENQHIEVRSPFLSDELPTSEAGFFETADRAQWADPEGFSLLGRSDGIVKIGGKRVDLAVTKEALMSVDGVRDAYVYAKPVRSGRENEILALVEGDVTSEQLTEAAARRLPAYARPRSIKVASKIPMTSTGKYQRTAIESYFKPQV